MARRPIPQYALEKKWGSTSTNSLIQAATQNSERKSTPNLDYDTNRNISVLGHRTMMSLGRWLLANYPQIRGALKEQTMFAVSTFIAQYYGLDQEFKDTAENWLYEHDKICDVRGWPYNMRTFLMNLVRSVRRDGDCGVLLADVDGYPMLQMIPAHRIGARTESQFVQDGDYKDMRICQGVILNEVGRAMAYRVMLGDTSSTTEYVDIPSTDMLLVFQPEYCDQVRGISEIGYIAWDCLDISEFKRAELISQVAMAGFAFQEFNEDGEPQPPGADFKIAPATDATTAETPSGLYQEVIDRGIARYFRTKSGAQIKQVTNDRPTTNQQNFIADTIRADYYGMGWSYDFGLDSSKVGGAPMRVIVEKMNLHLHDIRESIVIPTRRRIDGWRISKAIKRNELKQVPDWWKWEYQGPADITADKQYDSNVDIQEGRSLLQAPQDAIGRRGEYWEDVQDKAIAFEARFQAKCKLAGVDPEKIRWPTPNGPLPKQDEQKKANTTTTTQEKP